jgi:hypothetical protein
MLLLKLPTPAGFAWVDPGAVSAITGENDSKTCWLWSPGLFVADSDLSIEIALSRDECAQRINDARINNNLP